MQDLYFTCGRPAPCKAETFLRHDCGVSHRTLASLKHVPDGITRRGVLLRTVDTVYPGDIVRLRIVDAPAIAPNPALHAEAVFEDDDVVLFDKPAAMPVHPSFRHRDDTLGNVFAAGWPTLTFRPVHRLDRNTSGLTAVAKHPLAAMHLPGQLEKTYIAIAGGHLHGRGVIEAPIGRRDGSMIEHCVRPDGKRAVTHYRVLAQTADASVLAVTLETGRTHQIRVHMAYIGHPLLGDTLYGGDASAIERHALHCALMRYTDTAGTVHRVTAPFPADLCQILPLDFSVEDVL